MSQSMDRFLSLSSVIPVVTINDAAHALPLAETLLDSGVTIIEVTLRTDAALKSIELIRESAPDLSVGAGTIWREEDLRRAMEAGAEFGVSPGMTTRLLNAVLGSELPFLPGGQTVSEMAALAQHGFNVVKFFPAGAAGGVATLKAFSSVLPQLRFCPTGGVSMEDMGDYLALPCVPCVGGSWLAPPELIINQDWAAIGERCRQVPDL